MTSAKKPAGPVEAKDAPVSAEGYAAYVRRYFAVDALTYDRRERWRRRMRQALVDLAGVQPGEAVLDVCTGTGEVALALARRGAAVTGIDLSPEMLQHARRKLAGTPVQLLVGDAARLPFPDDAFAVSTLSMALHCMPATIRPQVLAEMARVSCRCVALLEPNTPSLAPGRWLLTRIGQWGGSPKYWTDFVQGDLRRLVAEAGLTVERRVLLDLGVHQGLACRPHP